jgi:signal transduction histidine kinase
MDGYEVAKLLKSNSRTRQIPIIFVTAINKDEEEVLRGFSEGAVDYLQKPLNVSVTKAKVNVFQQLYYYQYDLKESLQEVKKVNKQLERFVYIVSHDLKSPLSAIVTMLSVLQRNERVENDSYLCKELESISQAANYLTQMIASILEYSRLSIQHQTIEPVDVKELLQQITYLLFPPKNIKIIIEVPEIIIQTRKLKLQQVFQNLLSNAIKYNDKADGVIEIGVNEKDNFYVFYVKDNGPGIAEEDNHRIFKLFETTNNMSKTETGTGVGLNILKMLVEEQGGEVWVESKANEGSTFYFEWKK